jgi:hypothetical protein
MARPPTRQRVPPRLMTAEEFFELDIPDGKAELVRGRVIRMSFPGMRHGVIAPAANCATTLKISESISSVNQ